MVAVLEGNYGGRFSSGQSHDVVLTLVLVGGKHLVGLASDVLVGVAVEDFESLDDLVLVPLRRAVAHVVQDLVADLLGLIFGKLEDAGPELRHVAFDTARTHLLRRPKTHCLVFAPSQLYQLVHVVSLQSVKLSPELLLGLLDIVVPMAWFGFRVEPLIAALLLLLCFHKTIIKTIINWETKL